MLYKYKTSFSYIAIKNSNKHIVNYLVVLKNK